MTNSYIMLLCKMKEQADEFSQHLSGVLALNNEIKDKTTKLLKIMKEFQTKSKATCSVCYSRAPNTALVSCGHVFCDNCCQRAISRNRCFQCRSTIESSIRIYI